MLRCGTCMCGWQTAQRTPTATQSNAVYAWLSLRGVSHINPILPSVCHALIKRNWVRFWSQNLVYVYCERCVARSAPGRRTLERDAPVKISAKITSVAVTSKWRERQRFHWDCDWLCAYSRLFDFTQRIICLEKDPTQSVWCPLFHASTHRAIFNICCDFNGQTIWCVQ